jgi:hypothetical protein
MEYLVLGAAILVSLIVGTLIGIYVGTNRMRTAIESRTMGRLRIDHSEADEPTRMFVELKDVTPDMIARDKFVIFEVVNESYISHN